MHDICTELFSHVYIAKIKNMLISNDIITRKIHFMAISIENQLIKKIKNRFCMQFKSINLQILIMKEYY